MQELFAHIVLGLVLSGRHQLVFYGRFNETPLPVRPSFTLRRNYNTETNLAPQ